MGPVNDDDDMVTRTAPDAPVRSDFPNGDAVAEREVDEADRVEERLAPGIAVAGYGYGV